MANQICPRCGSRNVEIQLFKEDTGSQTITTGQSKYKEKGHGCLWWLLIGWWWWVIDLCMWVFAFPLRFLYQIFKKKKYVGSSTSVSTTKNSFEYRSECLCKDCGHHWKASSHPAPARRLNASPAPARSSGGSLIKEDFDVVGIRYYANNFRQLTSFNPDYNLSDEELKSKLSTQRSIPQALFVNKPVSLLPEPTNPNDPNAVQVVINGLLVGYISQSDNERVLDLLNGADIKYISSFIRGGKYLHLDDFGNLIENDIAPSIKIRIAYSE